MAWLEIPAERNPRATPMPFTVSHIAAILPFRRWLSKFGLFSAAAVGAMTPDLDLILPLRLTRAQTHGALALITFCLPVGLAVWALFQVLMKPAVIEVLPNRVFVRLRADHVGLDLAKWGSWALAAMAILFGAVTHDIWDGFTHEDGRGVRMLPFLDDYGPELGSHPLHLYRWLQHTSSVAGLLIVIAATWIWVRNAKSPNEPPPRKFSSRERHLWTALYLLIPVVLVGAAVVRIHHNGWPRIFSQAALTLFAILGILTSALSLVVTSALIRRRLIALDARQRRISRT
jgi:hypothetical protein